jgi:Transposase DDE domain
MIRITHGMLLLAYNCFQSGEAPMSDTYRRYGAIKRAIMQFYQPRPTGQREKHLNTLVALICGLVGGRHAHLSTIADHAPSNGAKQESVIDRFRRWLKHDHQTIDGWFLPVAQELLATLASQPLQLIMDGSVVGRGCISLMVSVVYHGRALPLCWVVVRGAKGHFPESTHRELLAHLKQIMPVGASVILLGDGEFDGTDLQADLREYRWDYVCRTASTILVSSCGVHFRVGDLGPPQGENVAVTPAWMTAREYGPVSILAIWEQQYKEPIYLVTTMPDLEEALLMYKKRPHIETFFSDLKSRGFHIDKSHLSDPKRLGRLLIACCLAYLWLVYLGVCGVRQDWMKRLHRQDRCDLSLFRLGLRLLARALKDHIPIPDGFLVPVDLPLPLVRSFAKKAA